MASVTSLVVDTIAKGQLALFNGFEDSNEILKSALGEDPRLGSLSSYADKYAQFAARAKLISKVDELFDLSEDERSLFRLQILIKDFGASGSGTDAINQLGQLLLNSSTSADLKKG